MANSKTSSSSKSKSSKTIKKVSKKAIKAAKKNPKKAILVVVILALLLAGVVGGYIAYKYFTAEPEIQLNGKDKMTIKVDGVYEEPGATATYRNEDISSYVTVSYYSSDHKTEVNEITTNIETTFYVHYDCTYDGKQAHTKTRIVNISNTAPLDITFLELGNKYTGDSTYIKAGDTDILIDAGSRQDSATAISNYVDNYCTDGKLEYVIATHAHQDHIAGFVGSKANPGIFDRYEIDYVIDFNGHNTDSAIYNSYVTKRDSNLESGKIKHHYTSLEWWNNKDGLQHSIEIATGITMELLYQEFYEKETSDENDYSVCVMFNQLDNHYLFTGDLEKDGEASLVENNSLPQVELFKGGHHGSYTANTDTLLSVIKPKVVCICCCAGSDEYTSNPDNMFPAQAAINRIGKYTDKVYVTTVVSDNEKGYESLNGNITCSCLDGMNMTVTGSNNSIILKETDWFKAHRTWPTV